MENVAEKLYNSLATIQDIQKLIDEGETEGQYLECKSPQSPSLDRGLKQQLAEEVSAFTNTGGGVILWGVSTTHHQQSKMDVLSAIEEIGSVRNLKKQIDLATATTTEPQIISCQSKVILRVSGNTKGIIVTYIPPTPGDPIRTTTNREFFIRIGAERNKMPYETIKRMFAGTSGPDLFALFNNKIVVKQDDGSWRVPIVIQNNSSAAAKDAEVSVTVINDSACDQILSDGFIDQSNINPGKKIYMSDVHAPVFRGKGVVVGTLIVKMKKHKLTRRKLELGIDVFATNMRAKTFTMVIQLAKKGFSVKRAKTDYLY